MLIPIFYFSVEPKWRAKRGAKLQMGGHALPLSTTPAFKKRGMFKTATGRNGDKSKPRQTKMATGPK